MLLVATAVWNNATVMDTNLHRTDRYIRNVSMFPCASEGMPRMGTSYPEGVFSAEEGTLMVPETVFKNLGTALPFLGLKFP